MKFLKIIALVAVLALNGTQTDLLAKTHKKNVGKEETTKTAKKHVKKDSKKTAHKKHGHNHKKAIAPTGAMRVSHFASFSE